MVEYPPLAPSIRWCGAFFKSWAKGIPESEAFLIANSTLRSPKDFGRYILKNQIEEYVKLSVAVEGGGKQLRTWDKINNLYLSEHGDWRKVHLGAWEAILGRKPFFRYLEPALRDVYCDLNLKSLKEFNIAIFKILIAYLLGNLKPNSVVLNERNSEWRERGLEIAERFDQETSIIQALAENGPEALLGIMALNYD